MKFGEVLKEIRTKNGDSIRGLADKADINFSFIDKVEKGIAQPSEKLLHGLLKVYPLYRKKLSLEYCKEKLPISVLKELKIDSEISEDFLDNILELVKTLEIDEQKSILNLILEKIEYKSLKNGKYKEVENMINEAKEKINEL